VSCIPRLRLTASEVDAAIKASSSNAVQNFCIIVKLLNLSNCVDTYFYTSTTSRRRGLNDFSAGSTICAWTFGTPHQRRKWRISRVQGPQNIDANRDRQYTLMCGERLSSSLCVALRRFATSITSHGMTCWSTYFFGTFPPTAQWQVVLKGCICITIIGLHAELGWASIVDPSWGSSMFYDLDTVPVFDESFATAWVGVLTCLLIQICFSSTARVDLAHLLITRYLYLYCTFTSCYYCS